MVANSDQISLRRCKQHPMIGKGEIGQKAEDLDYKAVSEDALKKR